MIQRYQHKDPAPHLPYEYDDLVFIDVDTIFEVLVWIALGAIFIGLMVGLLVL